VGLITYLWTIINTPFVVFYKHYVLVCIFDTFDNIRMSSCLLTMSVDQNVYVIHVLQVIRHIGFL